MYRFLTTFKMTLYKNANMGKYGEQVVSSKSSRYEYLIHSY